MSQKELETLRAQWIKEQAELVHENNALRERLDRSRKALLEPRIWSHITDGLPEEHPLANEQVNCTRCDELVHAANNECMQTWVEASKGPVCLYCFVAWTAML